MVVAHLLAKIISLSFFLSSPAQISNRYAAVCEKQFNLHAHTTENEEMKAGTAFFTFHFPNTTWVCNLAKRQMCSNLCFVYRYFITFG